MYLQIYFLFYHSKLHLDLVPRVDGEIVEADDTSVVELYKIHNSSEMTVKSRKISAIKSLSKYNTMKRVNSRGPISNHLFMTFKAFMCNIGDASTLTFALYDAKNSSYIR